MEKKVLIVANYFATISNFRMELLYELNNNNIRVVLALPPDDRNKIFDGLAEIVDIPLERFGTNPLHDLKTFFSIKTIINKYKPDYVFTYTVKPNIYGGIASRICKTPYACNVTGLGQKLQSDNLVGRIMLLMQKYAYQKANVVFCQNEQNYQLLKKHGIIDKQAEILPGSGVNLTTNQFEEYPNNEKITFVTIARIRQDKGYDELFNAIMRCSKEHLPVKFKIAGWYEDERYKEIIEEIKQTHIIDFLGDVPHNQIHGLISECDCLLHPSHHEGMSNVVLEAAATGRPCIVSNINGCIEGVEDGKTGLYFKVKNSEDLFERIKEFTLIPISERKKMGIKARKKMEKEFDRNIVVNKYMSLLNTK